jgi:type I restriction enzyme S subunit
MSTVEFWNTLTLKDIADINYGKSPSEILNDNGVYPVVGTGGIERFGDNYIYDGESIILGRKGTIEKVAYLNEKFWVIDTAYYLSNFKKIEVKWLYYFFHLINFKYLNEATGVPSLSRTRLHSLKINLPPIPEQTLIAKILSTADRTIEQTEAVIAKLQRIKNGLMQDLLTKGIDENGSIRSEETHKFKDSPLGRIPVEWEVYRLCEITEKIIDGTHNTPNYTEYGVPFITVKNLTGTDSIDFTELNFVSESDHQILYKRADPKDRDVLVTKDGTLGVARIVSDEMPPFSIFVSVAMIRPKSDFCIPELIWAFFESGEFEGQLGQLSAGTGLRHIHIEHFREFLIKIPPIKEQKRIFDILCHILESISSEAKILSKQKSLKTALMQDLLTGKVRVTELLKKKQAEVS